MLAGLFALGSIGFVALMVVATILLMILVEYNRPFWALGSIVGTATLVSIFGNFSVFG